MGQLRMEARPNDFSTNHANSGPLSGGSFCLQNINSTSNIHELENRSRSSNDRHVESVLDEHERLSFPPFALIGRCLSKIQRERVKELINTHCTSMANSAMVCSSPVSVVSETTPPAETAISPDESQRESPTDTSIKSSHVANIRNSLSHQGISTTLILSSWRKSTEDAYSCCWYRWEQWCASSGYNSIQAPTSAIFDFLACQFVDGKQYRTINSYCSAISMTHTPIDGVVVGKHPLVTRLMKGIFNCRPPQPRYAFIWDVGRVLEHIYSLGRITPLA